MMYRINAANSANPIGKVKTYDGNTTTIGDVIRDPELSTVLAGSTYSLNGQAITDADHHKTLAEFGLSETTTNFLMTIKAATGAC